MEIKGLFFDMDGLLLDTEAVYYSCWIKASKSLGYTIEDTFFLNLRSCDSVVAQKLFAEIGLHAEDYHRIRKLRKCMMQEYFEKKQIRLKEGVSVFFQSRKLDKYRKMIVTSSVSDEKLNCLRSAGILDHIDQVISVAAVSRGKPFPDVYQYACDKASCKPSNCFAFEDSPNGVSSAVSAGLRVFMIPDLSEPGDELRKKCYRVCNNILETLEFL